MTTRFARALAFTSFLGLACGIRAEVMTLTSPNGTVSVTLSTDLTFQVKLNNQLAVDKSPIRLRVNDSELSSGVSVTKVSRSRRSETYAWRGPHRIATNRYESATLNLKSGSGADFTLEFRAFDDGIAFRHTIPGEGARTPDESTAFALPDGSVVWHHGLGGHYEDVYKRSLLAEIKPGEWIAPPLTYKIPGRNIYAAITEAALVNYSGMALQAKGDGTFEMALGHKHPVSYPFRLRYSNDIDRVSSPYITKGTIRSPWRIIMVGRDLNALVNSDIVHNLCDPPDAKLFPRGLQTDWIKPGRAVWKYLDGGVNTFENMKDFSLWAGELGFEHHVIEGFWSRWSDDQIRELVNLSNERGVSLWLWRHSRELRTQEAQNSFFRKLQTNGIAGAKIDFFDHEHGEVVNLYTELLRKAAEHRIMVNFHGANKPTGESRTWPNELVREGVRGMESSRLRDRAIHNVTLPFTRYLAGTGDYTPVHFGARKGDTTDAHQVATAAVFNEPLLTFAAHPTNLLKHPALPMIKSIPAVWDETIVLPPSEIGKVAVFARRSGAAWFLAVLNGPESNAAEIPLSFLGPKKYRMLEVADDPSKPGLVQVSEKGISPRDSIPLKLTAGGGYIARFLAE